jgi:hypothetical protein
MTTGKTPIFSQDKPPASTLKTRFFIPNLLSIIFPYILCVGLFLRSVSQFNPALVALCCPSIARFVSTTLLRLPARSQH